MRPPKRQSPLASRHSDRSDTRDSKGALKHSPGMELLSERAQIGNSLVDHSNLIQKNAPRVLRRACTSEELCQPGADLRQRKAKRLRCTNVEQLLQHLVGKLTITVSRPLGGY